MRNSANGFILYMVISLCVIAFGQETTRNKEYPLLEFKNDNRYYNLVFESTVSRLNNKEEYPIFWKEIESHYKYLSRLPFSEYSKNEEFFKYTYTFHNVEKNKLKINLSASEVIDSPLVEIFRDFFLSIGYDEAKVEISFVAPGDPEKVDSPFNIMFWREGLTNQGKWVLIRAGSCRIYKPPTRLYIREEREVTNHRQNDLLR